MKLSTIVNRCLPLFGVVFFIGIVYAIGPMKIIHSFLGIDPGYLMLACAVMVLHFITQTVKWDLLLRVQKLRIGFIQLFKIYFIGMFYGMITPGRFGTFIRIFYVSKLSGRGFSESGSNVVLDKLIEMLGLFILGAAGIVIIIEYVSGILLYLSILFLAGLVAAIAMLTRKDITRKVLGIFYRHAVPSGYKGKASETFNMFYSNMPGARKLLLPSAVMMLSWVAAMTSSYLVLVALGVWSVPYHAFITLYPISIMIGFIPVTISGWGTREATLIALFSVFGVAPGTIIALNIILFAISSLASGLIGVVVSFTGGYGDMKGMQADLKKGGHNTCKKK